MKTTRAEWVCDRCKATVTLSPDKQPNWLGILFGTPPEADPNGMKWARKHLCPACDESFADWLFHAPGSAGEDRP